MLDDMAEVDRRAMLAGGAAAAVAPGLRLSTTPPEPDLCLPLWPGEAPGLERRDLADQVIARGTSPDWPDRAMLHIRTPRIDLFRPRRPNGAAVLIMPGGGYQRVVIDKEGYELADWLSRRGVAAFVLFYRLPGDGWARRSDVSLADAQRAMRLIRSRAGSFGIDPARVAALGYSAGGHVCASLATGHARRIHDATDAVDEFDARPMLAAPIYPVIAMAGPFAHGGSRDALLGPDPDAALATRHSPERHVGAHTPPMFLLHAEDDAAVPVENSLAMRAACRGANVPVETHLFREGGHGFGLRGAIGRPVAAWPELFLEWARSHDLLG